MRIPQVGHDVNGPCSSGIAQKYERVTSRLEHLNLPGILVQKGRRSWVILPRLRPTLIVKLKRLWIPRTGHRR